MTLQLSFSLQSGPTQIRNHLLQPSLCWYQMHNYIYIHSSNDHNMSDLANLIRVGGLEWGTIALEVISFVPRVATQPSPSHNLRLLSSWDWIQNNAAARCLLFRGELFWVFSLEWDGGFLPSTEHVLLLGGLSMSLLCQLWYAQCWANRQYSRFICENKTSLQKYRFAKNVSLNLEILKYQDPSVRKFCVKLGALGMHMCQLQDEIRGRFYLVMKPSRCNKSCTNYWYIHIKNKYN